jgi:Na+-transporting NADH:ubiquinone oxidoreductase subunit NqrC
MVIEKRMEILSIIISLLVIFSLVGCKSVGTDEAQIMQIAENIEEAIEEKEVDLFMENISYNYSDTEGGTYDNHINNLPEEIFSQIEDAEDLVDAFSILKIEIKVTIPESDLVLTDIYASGKMNIKISLKACILWTLCTTLYNENIEYNVDFIKEDDDWNIISLTEI